MNIECIPVKTRALNPPQDSIYPVLEEFLPHLQENDIVLITSKVLAIHQGRCIPIRDVPSKDALVQREAEYFIPREEVPHQAATLTIKENTLIPSAGVDESNANGYYILWPEKCNDLAKELWQWIREKYHLTNVAVVITDSHTTPLRWGVLGISIGFYGLEPLYDYRGKPDIFGRPLTITQRNVVDMLSVIGVAAMGEGAERTPIAIIRGVPNVVFTEESTYHKLIIPKEDDLYKPLLDRFQYDQ